MTRNTKVLILMTALAAGVASAQTVAANKGTNAGTIITNVAQVAFEDPTSTSPTPGTVTVNSNPVSTTVQPKYAFNISYADGSADNASTGTVLGAPATYTTTQLPQSTAVFKYAAVNDGNATQTITLGNAVTAVDPSTIKYYPAAADPDNNGLSADEIAAANAAPVGDPRRPITSVTVRPQGFDPISGSTNTGIVNFFMVYTVPSTSSTTNVSGQPVAGATPIGTGLTGNGTLDGGQPSGGTPLTETPASAPFEQYSQVVIATSGALVGQSGNPNGNGTDLYDSLAIAGVTTKIQENGSDKQTAGVTKNQTAVNFTNTLQNPGDLKDTFTLSAPSTLPSGVSSVTFLLPDGSPFPATKPATPNYNGLYYYLNASGVPTIEGVAPGATADFITQPNFTPGGSGTIDLPVTVTSANAVAAGVAVTTDTTHNLIAYPAASFGDNTDKTTSNNTPNPTADPNPTAPQGSTANLPMVIGNTSGAADTYTVQPTTVTFTVVDPATGTQSTVSQPVTYAVDTNCDGTPDSPVTPVPAPVSINPGNVYCMVAQVTVPTNAIAGQTPAITQTVSTGSGLTLTDTNDHITVALTNTANPTDNTNGKGVTVVKTRLAPTNLADAVPGARLDYQIVAKNTYNANVKNFILAEQDDPNTGTNVFANSCVVSVLGSVSKPALSLPAKVLYRFNGSGSWTTSGVPSGTGISAGTGNCAGGYTGVTKVEVAIDLDGNNTIDSNDYLAPTQELTVTFNTLIK